MSSDLVLDDITLTDDEAADFLGGAVEGFDERFGAGLGLQIGRASCRERV